MSMMKLAFWNFKSSFKNYLAVILSLSFTILVFFNFQNIVYSDLFSDLGGKSKEYIDILIQTISFVLGCFMFFFLWYATNVFLTKRKKEIGIYVFMGLTNQKIGRLYMIETTMIGISAIVFGLGFGVVTTHLFQMILLAISDITVDLSFRLAPEPILVTVCVYLVMYLIFVVKGYLNIVRSSVLDMVSAARKNEYVKQSNLTLWLKTVLGVGVLAAGYYLAVKEGGQEVMGNVFAAVVLVIIGVYLLFGGLIPLLFLHLSKKKAFLYQKERTLWINQVIFRIKKNYRTYAMTCVLMLCSVTALATGFAMKLRYDNMVHFRNTYTYQFLSTQSDLDNRLKEAIQKDNAIAYSAEISILQLDSSLVQTNTNSSAYAVVSYAQIKQLAKAAGLDVDFAEPKDDEIIKASHMYMLSLLTDRLHTTVAIHGKTYRQTADVNTPYLGYLQEMMNFYIVNDAEYHRLLPLGEEMHTYNYRIADIFNFAASKDEIDVFMGNMDEKNNIARITIDPNSSDLEWVKVLYTLCIFMFMVFILASGSILFMKLYNDAFEEKGRYQVLSKLGIAAKTLRRSLANELKVSYAMPFFVMAVSAYFSVHALENMMNTNLMPVYLVSVAVIFVCFSLFYLLSVAAYAKNAGVE